MIYVWDNDQSYSDHEICFVAGEDWPDDFVRLAIAQKGGRLVFTAEQVIWREDESLLLQKFFDFWDLFAVNADAINHVENVYMKPAAHNLCLYPDRAVVSRFMRAVADATTGRWRQAIKAEVSRLFPR